MNLNEQTTIIMHRVRSLKLNIWDLGGDLLFIQENKLYKEGFNSMKEYIEANESKDKFGFGIRQAQKYISIAKSLKRDELSSRHSLTELYLLSQIPDDKRDEVLELVEDKKIDQQGLRKEVKRLKSQAGSKPHYSDSLEEHCLRLIRQFSSIRVDFEGLTELKADLHQSVDNWLKSAKKHKDERIVKLIKEAEDILKEI